MNVMTTNWQWFLYLFYPKYNSTGQMLCHLLFPSWMQWCTKKRLPETFDTAWYRCGCGTYSKTARTGSRGQAESFIYFFFHLTFRMLSVLRRSGRRGAMCWRPHETRLRKTTQNGAKQKAHFAFRRLFFRKKILKVYYNDNDVLGTAFR